MRPFLFGFVIRGCNQKFSDFGFIPDLGKTNFRTFEVPRGSTKQHDIYSFGIIVQEGISGQYHRTIWGSNLQIPDKGNILSTRAVFHGL